MSITVSKKAYNNEKSRRWRQNHPEQMKKILADWYIKNRGKVLEKQKAYYEANREKIRAGRKMYYKRNEKKILERNRVWYKKRYHSNINFRLAHNLRARLRSSIALGIKSGSFVRDLGCSIDELRLYLERQFQPGMSWENWSYHGWHIDHKVPLNVFDLTRREEFLEACHYTNLRPLWAADNFSRPRDGSDLKCA